MYHKNGLDNYDKRKINFLNNLLLKEILQIFLGGVLFFAGGVVSSILESIMTNGIKCHWVYRELPAWLRFSLRKNAVCFKFFFFMDERCILEKLGESERLFWRWELNLFKNPSRERKVFTASTTSSRFSKKFRKSSSY